MILLLRAGLVMSQSEGLPSPGRGFQGSRALGNPRALAA